MTDIGMSVLTPLLPEIFLAFAGLVLVVVGAFKGNEGTAFVSSAVVFSFIVAALFLLGLDWDRTVVLGGMFVLDQFAGFVKLFILLGLIISVVISVRYIYAEGIVRFEYPLLILFAGIGMMVMVSANNLLTMYMGLELQSLALYVLAAIRRDHGKSAEAGIKYFVLGALASGMLLFGASLVYGYTGALGFEAIAAAVDGGVNNAGIIIGLVFVLVGLAFKVSAAPFHMWTPDVYEGAPTSVTAFFAIVPKVAAMALLIRVLYGPFAGAIDDWQQIIWFLAAASMGLGAFAGIVQTNIKRLIAYSSIGNMGYALVGVVSGTQAGVSAVLLYMIIYMIMTAGVFGMILIMRRNGKMVEEIADLAGLSRTSPLSAYAMAALMFSLSGIPPLAGFFGKLLVFKAAVASGFYILAIFGVITSVVAAYYYLRIVKVMFFDEPADAFDRQVAFSRRAVILMSVAFILLFILAPDMLVTTTHSAASAFFQ